MKKANTIKILSTIAVLILINIGSFSVAHAATANTLVDMANISRSEEGLNQLTVNDKLTRAAVAKGQDMVENSYFAHISPSGKTPWDFINAQNYNYVFAGENLSIGYTNDTELHDAWMNSPSHRENIMNKNYSEIGVAVIKGKYQGSNTTFVVQMFGEANDQVIVNNVKTEPVQKVLSSQAAVNEPVKQVGTNNLVYLNMFIILSMAIVSVTGYLIYRNIKSQKLT